MEIPAEVRMSMTTAAPDIEKHVHILIGSVSLGARLTVPAEAKKLVMLAHGSGSSQGRILPERNWKL